MSSVSEAEEAVTDGWQDLSAVWTQTAAVWNDSVRLRFEREYWQPYAPAVRRALAALQELDQVIDQAYRDLAD